MPRFMQGYNGRRPVPVEQRVARREMIIPTAAEIESSGGALKLPVHPLTGSVHQIVGNTPIKGAIDPFPMGRKPLEAKAVRLISGGAILGDVKVSRIAPNGKPGGGRRKPLNNLVFKGAPK